MNMRQLTAALVLTSACILAACSGSNGAKPAATGTAGGAPTTTTSSAAPVAPGDLSGLLLSEAESNTALGTKAWRSSHRDPRTTCPTTALTSLTKTALS